MKQGMYQTKIELYKERHCETYSNKAGLLHPEGFAMTACDDQYDLGVNL